MLTLVVTVPAPTGIFTVMEVLPSNSWTQPSPVTAEPPLLTVAVKLTTCPKTEGFGPLLVRVVIVLALSVNVVWAWEREPLAVR